MIKWIKIDKEALRKKVERDTRKYGSISRTKRGIKAGRIADMLEWHKEREERTKAT